MYAEWESGSAKNEYEMSFEMQSKLAIINFSFLVSHAIRSGSNTSLGRSPARFALINSKAFCVLSRSCWLFLASLEDAMVSKADEMRTTETEFPLDIVNERL